MEQCHFDGNWYTKQIPKQKLNTKSTTEYGVFGVSKDIPYKICLINFLKVQVYNLNKKVMYQDN